MTDTLTDTLMDKPASTTAGSKRANGTSKAGGRTADAANALSSAASSAASVASDVAQNAASATHASIQGLDGALKRLDDEPDQTLTIGAAFSLGVAAGLLLGGGPRLLALATAAPGIAMALTLLRRTQDAPV